MLSRIQLVVVGRMKDPLWKSLAVEYHARLSPYVGVEVLELKDSNDPLKDAPRILAALESGVGSVFALTEEGKGFTSQDFARSLARLEGKAVFVIGGPEGLHVSVKRRADQLLSLSPMTLTHEMARVFLTEQLYRAFNILAGGKYHKG